MEKVAKNGRKVKAIALLFCGFFPLFQKLKNWEKWTKSKGYKAYFLAIFSHVFKYEKVATFFAPFVKADG